MYCHFNPLVPDSLLSTVSPASLPGGWCRSGALSCSSWSPSVTTTLSWRPISGEGPSHPTCPIPHFPHHRPISPIHPAPSNSYLQGCEGDQPRLLGYWGQGPGASPPPHHLANIFTNYHLVYTLFLTLFTLCDEGGG